MVDNINKLFELGINPETLVVRSHPFGDIIDANSRKVFFTGLPKGTEYAVCSAIKYAMQAHRIESAIAEQERKKLMVEKWNKFHPDNPITEWPTGEVTNG